MLSNDFSKTHDIRECKRQQWQWECHKTIGFNEQYNGSAPVFYILVHNFAIFFKATM